ncbi:hypothetical protein K431DRAFT_280702 [Polychaeton citri CBS 116435]|uniref:Uncharacterized protein n=1 Tax=Polychaeton citri CBS 116435 TaxID=1314669 RepID=A0A9P4QEU4_9PEZI|nr:hypothetical protein K431DRAFT_280702 [Polychaeton citri CBS 116435]
MRIFIYFHLEIMLVITWKTFTTAFFQVIHLQTECCSKIYPVPNVSYQDANDVSAAASGFESSFTKSHQSGQGDRENGLLLVPYCSSHYMQLPLRWLIVCAFRHPRVHTGRRSKHGMVLTFPYLSDSRR